MTSERQKKIELDYLLAIALDEGLSEEQNQRVNELLGDPKLRRHYFRFLGITTALRRIEWEQLVFNPTIENPGVLDNELWEDLARHEKSAPAIWMEKPAKKSVGPVLMGIGEPKPERRISKFSIYTLLFSAAAALLFVAMLLFSPVHPTVATLTNSINAEWEGKLLKSGDGIRMQRYQLVRGLAEITLDSGAVVIVEAPSDFELLSKESMFLERGKLTANIGSSEIGFSVITQTAKFIDIGTEFGVRVYKTGVSQLHVFDGEVLLSAADSKKNKVSVFQGQAKQVNLDKSVSIIRSKEYGFVRQSEFDCRVRAEAGSSYNRWLAYSHQLRRDPALVAYYTFEKSPDDPATLLNAAPATLGRLTGQLGGNDDPQTKPTWVQGRWPQKDALAFEREKKQFVTVPDDPALRITGDITLAVWVNSADPTGRGMGQIVSCREKDKINYLFRYNNNSENPAKRGSLLFGRYEKLRDDHVVTTKQASYVPDTWRHLVVTHDNRIVKFYVDGELLETKRHVFEQEPVKADLLIGWEKNYVDRLSRNMFQGKMDEIAIFNRTLSDGEVLQLYENTKP